MKKILIGIIIAVTVVLIVFLYPKDAGSVCGFCPPTGVHKTEYGCIGFKYEYKEGCPDCGIEIKCMGIVTQEKKCYTSDAKQPPTYTEVPCS